MINVAVRPLKKILVIDDEIYGIRADRIYTVAKDFFEELRDIHQPLTISLVNFLVSNSDQFDIDLTLGINNIGPTDLYSQAISKKIFKENAPEEILTELQSLYDENDNVLKIREVIEEAFPSNSYEVSLLDKLPQNAYDESYLEDFDLIIVDLYLLPQQDDPTSTSYLNHISNFPNLPPIIIISSHFNNLDIVNTSAYFRKTNLSATGLSTLSKEKLLSNDFGSMGLQLMFQKMSNQRAISNKTRALIQTWKQTLTDTVESFSETLWKLDASIMQQLYNDAIEDTQSFDDLLNSFLSKELLWHMEKCSNLKVAMAQLSEGFSQADNINLLTYEVDVAAHRSMLSHHFYIGGEQVVELWRVYGNGRHQRTALKDLNKNLLTVLPFGSVLKSDTATGNSFIYINITQPCNLANFPRSVIKSENSPNSIMLIRAKITPKTNANFIPFNSERNISIFELIDNYGNILQAYDVDPQSSQVISLGLTDLLSFIKLQKLSRVGRIRPEIAINLQQQVAINLIRPSQSRFKRIGLRKVVVLLKKRGESEPLKFKQGEILNVVESEKNKITIPGRESLDMSLWLFKLLDDVSFNIETISEVLSKPLSLTAKKTIFQNIEIQFYEIDNLANALQKLRSMSGSKELNLFIFIEKAP
ncbi:hypothetical protein [Aquirhabdus parva]|uniref:Uncharacterized protein n=1 Tax=Aquirhabdus parva TaxID=2283318 RepID=A0A345P2Z2_9GAMM|nr:hypothetical protein [Aquirhabdus parva]AXI01651.1 hypothetical protein HYN46_01325 [Aquirhabdus parva]